MANQISGMPARYLSTPPTLSNKQATSLLTDQNGNLMVTLASKLNAADDVVATLAKGYLPLNITATGQVLSGAGSISGFYVHSTTSGTLQLCNNTSANAPDNIGSTITPAVGWHSFPARFTNGLHVTVGGTIDVTFFPYLGATA